MRWRRVRRGIGQVTGVRATWWRGSQHSGSHWGGLHTQQLVWLWSHRGVGSPAGDARGGLSAHTLVCPGRQQTPPPATTPTNLALNHDLDRFFQAHHQQQQHHTTPPYPHPTGGVPPLTNQPTPRCCALTPAQAPGLSSWLSCTDPCRPCARGPAAG